MNCLLDTNALLWFTLQHSRLTARAIATLKEATTVWWSPINLWEIGLKMSRGGFDNLELPTRWELHFPGMCLKYSILELPIKPAHCRCIQDLPYRHKDPFDRMLVAQAREERLAIISSDEIFDAYGVKRIW